MYKILLITLITISSVSFAAVAKRSVANFSGHTSKISITSLKVTYSKGGLDAVVEDFYNATEAVRLEYKDLQKSKKGLRVTDESGKKILGLLIESAQYITDNIDLGNLHHYGLALLFKEMPVDFNLALERSGLSAEQKDDMRESLKQNIKNEG